jgi:CRISPR-associated protein (TIGR02584 family)
MGGVMGNKKQVLIVVLGTSPAILTETVWALAVNEKIVPDEIEIWTTKTGKDTFEAQALTKDAKTKKTVWKSLKADLIKRKIDIADKLVLGDDSWKIFANTKKQNLEDLLTTEDNLAAADKMLAELRKYDEPSTQILLSIAGGRKTMGALALQCMSLLGREGDKVYHVLVNDPFDTRLMPPFFFPEKKGTKWQTREKQDKTTVTDKEAQINLFSVPYIRVRPLYEEKLKEKVVSFSALCERIQEKINRKPTLRISEKQGKVWLDNTEIKKLSPVDFYTLFIVLKKTPYTKKCLYEELRRLSNISRSTSFNIPKILQNLAKYSENLNRSKKSLICEYDEDPKRCDGVIVDALSNCRTNLSKVSEDVARCLLPKDRETREPDFSCVKVEIVE